MRLGALRKSVRPDVSQASSVGGLARHTSASKGNDASTSEESRFRAPLGNGGGADDALEGSRGTVTQRILEQIRMGYIVCTVSTATGAPEVFVPTLLEHYDRPGIFDDAGSLCSPGLGACHTEDVSNEVRMACAEYPPAI